MKWCFVVMYEIKSKCLIRVCLYFRTKSPLSKPLIETHSSDSLLLGNILYVLNRFNIVDALLIMFSWFVIIVIRWSQLEFGQILYYWC